jgi:hypothetical protein
MPETAYHPPNLETGLIVEPVIPDIQVGMDIEGTSG